MIIITSVITMATLYAVTETAGTAEAAVIMVAEATSIPTETPTSPEARISPATKSISTVAATSTRIVSNPHNGLPAGSPISATGEDRPIRKGCNNGSGEANNPLWPVSDLVQRRRFRLQRGASPKPDNGQPPELCQPSADHPAPTFVTDSRKSPEPRTSSRTN
jgi:hypothetical protein